MTQRRLYLDIAPGESRGVVMLDDQPERLLIERSGVDRGPRPGARYIGRIDEIAPGLRLAYLDLGGGDRAVLTPPRNSALVRGASIEVEVTAEARGDKAAAARLLGPGSGAPRLLAQAPTLEARLAAAAPGVALTHGDDAREAADEAQAAALEVVHQLPDGLRLSIEPTAALVAVDLDWTGAGSGPAALKANLRGLAHAARLLRLKSLAGAVVIDLIGFPGREAGAVLAEARHLFEPDQPGVSVLPVSRLGLMELSLPHRERPVLELLCAGDGRLSARSVAQGLARDMARQARADPGARIVGVCAADTAAALEPLIAAMGPRFEVARELGWDRLKTDIRTR